MQIDVTVLLDYTEWERQEWHTWFREQGAPALAVSIGEHGDGRMTNVGELVRHIFSAEQRYVDRISGTPLSETATVPPNDVSALFAFGAASRRALRDLLASLPEERWDTAQEIKVGPHTRQVTPRKLVLQTLLHETRHWSQVSTFLRLAGFKLRPHDFLLSPVLDPRV